MKAYIDREERRRAFVAGRWKKREQERVVREAESKRMAGIATVAPLSEQAKLQKLKVSIAFKNLQTCAVIVNC